MVIFNVIIPRNNLCCVICKIKKDENDTHLEHIYKLKYRTFLEKMAPQAAIAAPKDLNAGSIYIIVAKNHFESLDFQNCCTSLNIQFVEILDPIPDSIYEMCLLNTVKYKLEPQWNKVGQYLVEGQNFFNDSIENAIELNINIRDNNVQFDVTPLNLQIPFLRSERNLQVPYPVKVLPSLANACAMRALAVIPREYPFENYTALREYWRQIHGYILPVDEEGLLFYEVGFFPNQTKVYPEMCLTLEQNIFSRVNNANGIYERFVENLRGRVPTLCGQQLIYPEV